MKLLVDSYKQNRNLHHAYAFEGNVEIILEGLISFFQKELNFLVQGNPDYWFSEYEVLGIDEARLLAETQMKKSLSGGRKIFVISVQGMTVEAQNALLKVFEEPAPETHFFLILNSFDHLLPTLKSRIFFVNSSQKKSADVKLGRNFLRASIGERISIIQQMSEEKNKKQAEELLNTVEVALSEELKKQKSPELISSLEELYRAKGYLHDRSSSVKMLLEHVAHTIVVI